MTNTLHIAIVGNGFAATQCALVLSKQLSSDIKLTFIRTLSEVDSDILYGSVTSPEAYKNNLQLGLSEPELLLNTSSSFSFGSKFVDWGNNKLNWMQCFHLPFMAEAGVFFHHFMTRHKASLSDYLIGEQAAQLGRFAHPPDDKPQSALARAEYGYHFNPQEWSALFLSKLKNCTVNIIDANVVSVKAPLGNIESIALSTGEVVSADLFVDCTGTKAELLLILEEWQRQQAEPDLATGFIVQRNVSIKSEVVKVAKTGPSYRQVTGTADGWQSVTPLQNSNLVFSLHDSALACDIDSPNQSISIGHRPQAWIENCVAIGHAAYVIEPLTPAPYMLLSKDLGRLLELIPIDKNMAMESKEYNRRYMNDLIHAELFHRAMYYGQKELGFDHSPKLERKLTQFCHRGVLANYDLEPFNNEDWVILHMGMGRVPLHYDKLAEQVSYDEMAEKLARMRKGIAHLAAQIPPHDIYITKFLQFLREKHASEL